MHETLREGGATRRKRNPIDEEMKQRQTCQSQTCRDYFGLQDRYDFY